MNLHVASGNSSAGRPGGRAPGEAPARSASLAPRGEPLPRPSTGSSGVTLPPLRQLRAQIVPARGAGVARPGASVGVVRIPKCRYRKSSSLEPVGDALGSGPEQRRRPRPLDQGLSPPGVGAMLSPSPPLVRTSATTGVPLAALADLGIAQASQLPYRQSCAGSVTTPALSAGSLVVDADHGSRRRMRPAPPIAESVLVPQNTQRRIRGRGRPPTGGRTPRGTRASKTGPWSSRLSVRAWIPFRRSRVDVRTS
jgi:hypothetical protein